MSGRCEAGNGEIDAESCAASAPVLPLPVPRSVDLVASTWSLLGRYQENTGVRTRLRVSPDWPQRLGEGAGAALQRLMEQVLIDVQLRSERVSRVDVELESDGDRLVLVVRDDGAPVDPADLPEGEDARLERMHAWAVAHGGTVLVVGEGSGTTVRATIPAR
jgi:signal transduction histidine kinase